jgi:hypothetical protein
MFRSNKRHAQELHDIQKHPDRYKCAYRHIPAVPEFQLFLATICFVQVVKAAPPREKRGTTWPEEPTDEEEEERCGDEGEQEEVSEYEDERDV